MNGNAAQNGINRGYRRLLVTLMMSTALWAGPFSPLLPLVPASAQSARTHSFNIPSQPLNRALRALADQSGVQIAYQTSIASGAVAPAVSGTMTTEQALSRLISGSGLSYGFTNSNTVTITGGVQAAGGSPSDATTLAPIIIQGQAQEAFGPQNGFIAQNSVSGTKSDTPIVETPYSVSVINRKQLDAQTPQSLPEALRYTPGVATGFFGNDTRNLDAQVYIRGFGDDPSQLFWNGLSLPGDSYVNSPTIDPYTLEQIEVLRGPASVLYGQSAPGGIVNFRSKRPTEQPLHEVVVGTGNYGRAYTGFDFGGPITEDGDLLYRLTGVAYHTGTQVDFTANERIAIAPSLTWKPDEDTELTVLGSYQRDPDGLGFSSLPLVGTLLPSVSGRIPTDRYFGEPDYDEFDRETASIGYEFKHRFDEVWSFNQNFRFLHAGGHYREIQPDDWTDATNTEISRWNWGTDGILNAVAIDNQLQAEFDTGQLSHTLLFGLDYKKQWTHLHHYWSRIGVPDLNVADPVYASSIPDPAEIVNSKGTLEQTGIYAQDQVEFGNWRFLAGIRQDWSETTSQNLRVAGSPETSQKDDAFTWRVGAVYLFDNGLAPYASYTTSFKPEAGTDFGGNTFEPTTAQQYEVGIKYQPEGLDSFVQASIFDLTQQNVQTPDPDPTHVGFSVQTGEVRVRGIELSTFLALNDNIDLVASYTYNDIETTKANTDTSGFNPEGRVPWYYPKQTASAWLNYTFDSGALEGLKLGGGIRYVGSGYNGPHQLYKVPDFTLFDAAVSYDFGAKTPELAGLELSVNVSNLFDKEYLARCSEINCSYGIRRTVLANLKYKW